MAYDNDQCVHCGGIRATESPLCVGCLVTLVNTYAPAHDIAEARIKKLEHEKKALSELVERLLDHISSEAVYTSELRLELLRLRKSISAGGSHEKAG